MKIFATVIISLLILALVLLYNLQKWMFYFPQFGFIARNFPWQKQTANDAKINLRRYGQYSTPDYFDLSYEDVFIPMLDGTVIHSWFIRSHNDPEHCPTVIFFHGNAGSISLRLPFFARLITECNCNVFAVEYRGFGFSDGSPCETKLISDAYSCIECLFSHAAGYKNVHPLRKRYKAIMKESKITVNHDEIFVFGRSLGGAVTIGALSSFSGLSKKIKGFIVENTFLSLPDVVRAIGKKMIQNDLAYSLCFDYALPIIMHLSWQNKLRINKINKAALFMSGRQDRIVPPTHMDRLWKLFNKVGESRFVTFPNGRHNTGWFQQGYFKAVAEFINDLTDKK